MTLFQNAVLLNHLKNIDKLKESELKERLDALTFTQLFYHFNPGTLQV